MKQTQQLLIIGQVFPEPTSSAAGTRMLQLIELFLKQGYEITFASAAIPSEYAAVFVPSISCVQIHLNDASFDTFVANLNPAIVLFDRFMIEEQFGWRVAEFCPNAIRILDTEDLHFLRIGRQQAIKNNDEFEINQLFTSDTTKREIASILRCDLSLLISEFEMELLQQVFSISPKILYYLPLLLNNSQLDNFNSLPSLTERNDFCFVGNFWHAPNWNAVLYLKEVIWPLIHSQLPQTNLHIYGAYTSQKVLNLSNSKEHFLVHGRIDDVHQMLRQHRVLLAPLRFGAGIKGKILDAMLNGTPVMTTSIGAESMHGTLPWCGGIEDDPILFANHAVKLYQNSHEWEKAQQNGKEILQKRYAISLFETDFYTFISELTIGINKHRQTNFLSTLLMHHSLASTKYMSKWIEAKNQKS